MLETARSKSIDTYLKKHPQQQVPNQTMHIVYGGKHHPHPLYRVPIDYLIHNIRNGRFRSELLEKEEQLKRKVDPTKKDDADIIRELLLNQNEAETIALQADIEKNGQLEPGIITFDGAVINANRRLAILHKLYEKTRDDRFGYLMVGILPPGVDEADLWKIEAGLQFGRDFRLQYGGVNELLKLREGQKQGLSAKDISVALLGRFSEKQVDDKLEILDLIDSYLEFINKKGQYHLITEGQDLEKFNSLYNNVIAPLKKKHGKKKVEVAQLTMIAFSLINKADVTHWDIRKLRDININEKANKELLAPFGKSIPSAVSGIRASQDKLKEAYKSAQEIVDIEKEKDKPERLLKMAKSALYGINEKSKKLKEPAMLAQLKELKDRIDFLIKSSKV